MFSIIIWTLLLLFTIYKANKIESISGSLLYLHSFVLWIFLMLFVTSFRMLGWAIGHSEDIQKYFIYK